MATILKNGATETVPTREKNLRQLIGEAICRRFNETFEEHGVDYDPDTCWEAADDVIAVLLAQLTGQVVRTGPKSLIGHVPYELDPDWID